MRIKISKTVEIKSVDEWRIYAPPRGKDRQWKDGHSAKLFAQYALSKNFADDMQKIINSCGFIVPSELLCLPEFNTKLLSTGSGRNHDLLIEGKDFIIGIEAKVSEPFGNEIVKEYEGKGEGKQNRIKTLLKYINKSFDEAKRYKYQLLTGLVGTMLEAYRRGKNKCLFLIVSFTGDVDASDKSLDTNRDDYAEFCTGLLGVLPEGGANTYCIDGTEITCYVKKMEINFKQGQFVSGL